MQKAKKNIIIFMLGILLVLSAFCLALSLGARSGFAEAQLSFYGEELKSEYDCGEILVVPNAELEYQGAKYPATEKVLYYPDGVATSFEQAKLSLSGNYKVVYSAKVGNVKIKAEEEFVVNKGLYQATTTASTIGYEQDLSLPKMAFGETTTTDGLKLKIADGDQFVYNQAIDLRECQNGFLTFFTESCNYHLGRNNYSEVNNLFIRLTDAYDANSYVELEIVYENAQGSKIPYYRAAPNGKRFAGCEKSSYDDTYKNTLALTKYDLANRREVFIDGTRYIVRYKTYGTTSASTTANVGGTNQYVAWDKGFTAYYDLETNKIFYKDAAKHFISELDNTDIYDGNDFEGFTTGEVILSIYGTGYSSSYLNLQLTKVGNDEGEALQMRRVEDDINPFIKVNAKDTVYKAVQGKPFKIFPAKLIDMNSSGKVDVSVYYAYGTTDQVKVSVDANQTFTPVFSGKYTLKYTAKDFWGNEAEPVLIEVNVLDDSNKEIATLNVQEIDSLIYSTKNRLPAYDFFAYNEYSYVNVSLISKVDGSVIKLKDNQEFIPTVYGEYEVVYEYGDEIYQYEYRYSVNCVDPNGVIYLEKPTLPIYFIKGMAYSLDKFYAYSFDEGEKTEYLTDVYASVDNGAFEQININEFFIEGSEQVKLKFAIEDVFYNGGQEFLVPIVDVSYNPELLEFDLSKYFVSDDAVVIECKENCVDFSISEGEKTQISFVKEIPMQVFDMTFYIPKAQSKFESLTITLTDYYDRDKSFDITFNPLKTKDSVDIFEMVVGDTFRWRKTSLFDTEISISYNPTLYQIKLSDGTTFETPIRFLKDKVLCTWSFEGVRGEVNFQLREFCEQKMSNTSSDQLYPLSNVEQSCGLYSKGSTITVYELMATDLFTPVLRKNIKVRMVSPSGANVYSKDNVLLNGNCPSDRDYEVELNEYGMYRVYYSFSDQNYNSFNLSYPVEVVDIEKPTITLKGVKEGGVQQAKYLSRVSICNFSVKDDESSGKDLTTFVSVISPRGTLITLTGKTFGATDKGVWTVIINCYDKQGNMATAMYKVNVK